MNREDILNALRAFAESRPGVDSRNYVSGYSTRERFREELANYRAETRRITKQLHDARILLNAVKWRSSIEVTHLQEAFRAYSGRLTLTETPTGGASLSYCAGQYYCVEYRAAVCAVLSAALWAYTREHAMPKPVPGTIEGHELYPFRKGKQLRAGDWLRAYFKREFGASIAQRWFS